MPKAKPQPDPTYPTLDTFAEALGVTRQTLHQWRKASWWPVADRGPFDADDLAAVLEAKAEVDGTTEDSADANAALKRAQTNKARALAIRYQRQSEVELSRLMPSSVFERFIEQISSGGALTVALQACYWRMSDAVHGFLTGKGRGLSDAERSELDAVLREALGNPVGEAVLGALESASERTAEDDPLTPLMNEAIKLNRDMGRRGPLEDLEDEARAELGASA